VPITALNRTDQRAFLALLEHEILASHPESMLGLLLMQLSGLEELNFSAGYRAADQLLTEVSAKLEEAFRDRAGVVRIGTSRFAILLRELRSEGHAVLAAHRVERLAQELLQVGSLNAERSFLQGIALYPTHARTADRLLQCAEIALGFARNGGPPVAVYRAEEAVVLQQTHRVSEDLTRALEFGGIEAFYQPQIDVASGRPVGAEALLRCRDRHGSMLPPESVVAAAQRTNRLAELTSAILNTALRHAAEWPLSGSRLSVNVSTHSLKDPDFPALVAAALSIWDRPPAELTVEITESAFIDDPQKSFAAMRALNGQGVRVSIDDFGTGYSSLSYFTNIPARELKVDKSFVLRMLKSDADRRIVQAVVNLAHGFDLEVVAEGVEDLETLEVLRRMGCDVAQGYWVGRPLPAVQFVEWLAQHAPLAPPAVPGNS
jgi:predicted signal transduction protein with EAL and GGDEF domain